MVAILDPERVSCIDLHTLPSLISLDISAWDDPERETEDDAEPCPGGCTHGWILQADECYTPCETCNPEAS